MEFVYIIASAVIGAILGFAFRGKISKQVKSAGADLQADVIKEAKKL